MAAPGREGVGEEQEEVQVEEMPLGQQVTVVRESLLTPAKTDCLVHSGTTTITT